MKVAAAFVLLRAYHLELAIVGKEMQRATIPPLKAKSARCQNNSCHPVFVDEERQSLLLWG